MPAAIPRLWRSKMCRPATTLWPKPSRAGATRRRTGKICSKAVSQNWALRRVMLQIPNTRYSGRSFLHQPTRDDLGVIRRGGLVIDAAAIYRHGIVVLVFNWVA